MSDWRKQLEEKGKSEGQKVAEKEAEEKVLDRLILYLVSAAFQKMVGVMMESQKLLAQQRPSLSQAGNKNKFEVNGKYIEINFIEADSKIEIDINGQKDEIIYNRQEGAGFLALRSDQFTPVHEEDFLGQKINELV